MKVLAFRYSGRFGLFLRAGATTTWLTYPLPPRTVLLGMLGALLGLDKDQPQIALADARIAVAGPTPQTYWHSALIRKDFLTFPQRLSLKSSESSAKKKKPSPSSSEGTRFDDKTANDSKGSQGSEGKQSDAEGTRISQEWLLSPSYTIYAHLSSPWHEDLARRVKDGAFVYSPSLGLSEMLAQIEFLSEGDAEPLPEGEYDGSTVVRCSQATLRAKKAIAQRLHLQTIQMPRCVTEDRIFSMESYFFERKAQTIPIHTSHAYRYNDHVITFL